MGCDIHCYAEVLKDGKWEKVGAIFPNPYHDPEKPEEPPDEDGYVWNARLIDHPYRLRSYDTFAILANVRNGVGFAGCDTGDGFRPIAKPRGLPGDVSPEVAAKSEEWGSDGHSHSHLLLAEILAYDWQQVTTHRGYVDGEEFARYQAEGKPYSYCGGVSGRGIKIVGNEEMARLVAAGKAKNGMGDDGYHTQVAWTTTYAESARSFLNTTVEELKKLGPPDRVRLVFWFDN